MLFDTDVLIWALRGHKKASRLIDDTQRPFVSIISYLELLQGARDRDDIRTIKNFLHDVGFEILPLTENTGHRAAIYMEQFVLGYSIGLADALIAATAADNNLPLVTGNKKHFSPITELEVVVFRAK